MCATWRELLKDLHVWPVRAVPVIELSQALIVRFIDCPWPRKIITRGHLPYVHLTPSFTTVVTPDNSAIPQYYASIFTMLLLLFLFMGHGLVSASNLTLSFLARRETFSCAVLPITPTDINGLTPCGDGSLVAGCSCCADGLIGCLDAIETCSFGSAGESVCACDDGVDCSSCHAQGLIDCGSGCLPSGYTCCSDQTYGCPSSEQCCQLSDGSDGCCSLGSAASTTDAAPSTTDASSPTDVASTAAASFPTDAASTAAASFPTDAASTAAVSTGGSAQTSSTTTASNPISTSAAHVQTIDIIAVLLIASLFSTLGDVL